MNRRVDVTDRPDDAPAAILDQQRDETGVAESLGAPPNHLLERRIEVGGRLGENVGGLGQQAEAGGLPFHFLKGAAQLGPRLLGPPQILTQHHGRRPFAGVPDAAFQGIGGELVLAQVVGCPTA